MVIWWTYCSQVACRQETCVRLGARLRAGRRLVSGWEPSRVQARYLCQVGSHVTCRPETCVRLGAKSRAGQRLVSGWEPSHVQARDLCQVRSQVACRLETCVRLGAKSRAGQRLVSGWNSVFCLRIAGRSILTHWPLGDLNDILNE